MTRPGPQLDPSQRRALREAARAALAIDHLEDFVRQAWPIIEPGTLLIWNWHLTLICRVLEMLTRGELFYPDGRLVREVLICIPPGMMKSILVSVMWPAWQWLQKPTERNLCTANSESLVRRDSRRSRDIITHDWYRNLVRLIAERDGTEVWELKDDQNQLINFGTTVQGFRQCMPITANVTGHRVHGELFDDPYDAAEATLGSVAQVLKRMADVILRYRTVFASRVSGQLPVGYRVTVMQRLHMVELAAYLIKKGAYTVVLPMEYDPNHPQLYPDDPRTEAGELLFPELFPQEVVEEMKAELGARHYAAQGQQLPVPAAGGIYQRAWTTQRYNTDPQRMVMDEWAITVDCTFKGKDTSDFVSMQVWGRRKLAEFFLLDRVYARMTYTETRQRFVELVVKWPQARLRLIEEAANGPALIDDLRRAIPGLVGFNPQASKDARNQLAARYFEALNVWLPSPEVAPWIGDYVDNICGFRVGAANDDDPDATAQILLYWNRGDLVDPLQAIKNTYGFLDDMLL